MVRTVIPSDATQIAEIYNTVVTFEEEPVVAEVMLGRITEVTEKFPWLVYELDGNVIGYAYASSWKSRCAYKYSVETTVYLKKGMSGKGYGAALYAELLERLNKLNLHGIIGGIALPNEGSIALHKKFGFEQVAHFKEVGNKFNKWIDVTYWEKIL